MPQRHISVRSNQNACHSFTFSKITRTASMPSRFQNLSCALHIRLNWWSQSGSNRRPPACKAGALPAELWPQASSGHRSRPCAMLSECRCLVRVPDRTVSHSRKEVIQPHLPIRLPCYDFTPVTNPAVVIALLAVRLTTSGRTRSHGVTGGVYKTRERIHRDMLIRDY